VEKLCTPAVPPILRVALWHAHGFILKNVTLSTKMLQLTTLRVD